MVLERVRKSKIEKDVKHKRFMSISIDETLHKKLREKAKKEGFPMYYYVEDFLIDFLGLPKEMEWQFTKQQVRDLKEGKNE